MVYSINPNLPKVRAFVMKLLICKLLPLVVVVRKCGVNRSTIWRWKCKWNELNQNVQLTNYNRPSRKQTIPSSQFRLNAIRWNIPTVSSCSTFLFMDALQANFSSWYYWFENSLTIMPKWSGIT